MIDTTLFDASARVPVAVDATVDVKATPRQVFDAWTTAEGLKAWLGVGARIELCIGGAYEWLFLADAPAGAQGSEGCQILAYVPDELLAFSWNAPPQLAYARSRRAWCVLTLEPLSTGTRVRVRHLGLGVEGDWPEVGPYFARAWPGVLERLTAHFGAA